MRLRSIAITALVTALVVIPFGAAAFTAGNYPVSGDVNAEVVVGDDGSVTIDGLNGSAWNVETSDAEIEFLFITDTKDAFVVSLEDDDGDVTITVKPKNWDEDKIDRVLSGGDDDDDGGDEGEGDGKALGQDRDPDAPPGAHGRDNAQDNGGNAYGWGAEGNPPGGPPTDTPDATFRGKSDEHRPEDPGSQGRGRH